MPDTLKLSAPVSTVAGNVTAQKKKTHGLPRQLRLRHAGDFEEIYARGRHYTGRLMVMWMRMKEDGDLRLGVVTSRRIGGAVQRNRARRRLREIFRTRRDLFKEQADVILVARRPIVHAAWHALEMELLKLAERAGLLQKTRQ